MSLFFSVKDPEEVITLTVDFTATLEAGETINSATWSITRDGATEDTTAMMIGGADITAAPLVRQKVGGGTHGATYLHRAKIVTSAGRTLVHGVRQTVSLGA